MNTPRITKNQLHKILLFKYNCVSSEQSSEPIITKKQNYDKNIIRYKLEAYENLLKKEEKELLLCYYKELFIIITKCHKNKKYGSDFLEYVWHNCPSIIYRYVYIIHTCLLNIIQLQKIENEYGVLVYDTICFKPIKMTRAQIKSYFDQ